MKRIENKIFNKYFGLTQWNISWLYQTSRLQPLFVSMATCHVIFSPIWRREMCGIFTAYATVENYFIRMPIRYFLKLLHLFFIMLASEDVYRNVLSYLLPFCYKYRRNLLVFAALKHFYVIIYRIRRRN